MSKIHVLTGGGGSYNAVVHSPVPTGNNLAGISWQVCLKNSGFVPLVSKLPIGVDAGQITSAEAAQISAGTVVEYELTIPLNGDGTAPTIQVMNGLADSLIASKNASIGAVLAYYGYTQ